MKKKGNLCILISLRKIAQLSNHLRFKLFLNYDCSFQLVAQSGCLSCSPLINLPGSRKKERVRRDMLPPQSKDISDYQI